MLVNESCLFAELKLESFRELFDFFMFLKKLLYFLFPNQIQQATQLLNQLLQTFTKSNFMKT